jgi:hypothetical protein
MEDGSTQELTITAVSANEMDEDFIESLIDDAYDGLDIDSIDSIDQVIGIDKIRKVLEENIVLFMDANQTFMGFACVFMDLDAYRFTYDPYITTYAIMDSTVKSIEMTCVVDKPLSPSVLSVTPDFMQNDFTAPDYIKNKPFGIYQFINFENEEYSDVYDS